MVRDEPFFLPRWIAHYAAHVPKSQLFILFDGADQPVPPEAAGCHCLTLPRAEMTTGWDERRWKMLADYTAALLGRFEVVVTGDVDELILADPASGETLPQAILRARDVGVISPFALEVVQRLDLEPAPLDPGQPILGQRRHVRINASYCKPCITSRPIRWSVGGHYSSHPDLHLDRVLHLFHLRFIDHAMLAARQASRHAATAGQGRGAEIVAGGGWTKAADEMGAFLETFVAAGPPISDDFRFDWQRKRIEASWQHDPCQGIWRHDRLHNRKTYALPDRFLGLF